jgi:hypothetical protein
MKILKLLEIYDDPTDTWAQDGGTWSAMPPRAKRAVTRIRDRPNHKMLGSGLNAYVGTNDNANFSPVTRIAGEEDSTNVYLEMIATGSIPEELKGNPYLPKVLSIKKPKGIYQITLERLIPFETPSIITKSDFFRSIWKKCLTEPYPDEDNNKYDLPTHKFATTLQRAAYKPAVCMSLIKDPQLIEVLQWIGSYERKKNPITNNYFACDIHAGNLMWRPGKYVFQIVIADPWN